MRIFRRITDIITANLTEMIERFENPEIMLRQAVREIDDALRDTMDRAARVIAQEKLLARQLVDHERQSAAWQERARQAVARNDDPAARHAIARKREHERMAAALTNQVVSTQEAAVRMRGQVESLKAVHADARGRLTVLSARQRVAETQRQLARFATSDCGTLAAFTQFERWSERIERDEAESEALLELAGRGGDHAFATDEAQQIELELDALKQTAETHGSEP